MDYALVTGGSRGIGRACAIRLSHMGYPVLINYRSNQEEAETSLRMITEAGGKAELLPFDVSRKDMVEQALSIWQETHPGDAIQVLVNNAGIRKDALVMWMKDEEWFDVLDTNLHSFFYLTRILVKEMLIRKSGRIINVVSLSGLKGMPGQANYSAAKGGIISATKALALEVAKKKVTVNAVAPGFIATDMTKELDEQQLKAMIPMGRFGTPEEVAAVVGFLASAEASYVTGAVINVNGGLYT